MKICFILIGLLFSSCQTLLPKDFVAELAQKNHLTHIESHCKIMNLKGEVIHSVDGYLCVFEDNGDTLVFSKKKLYRLDKKTNLLWEKNFDLNHQLKPALFSDGYLTIRYRYYNKSKGLSRYDEVLLLNRNGEIVKSFNFKKIIDKNSKATGWPLEFKNQTNQPVLYEYTHVNSIAETYKIVNAKKIHTGYVVNDLKNRQFYFLDTELKQVTNIIESQDRAIHDVQPINENKFIFYMNEKGRRVVENKIIFSSIEVYNLQTNQFETYYDNNNTELISKVCSSVQYVSPDELFIFHSACPHDTNPENKLPKAEFVKLSTKESKVIELKDLKFSIEARLINASEHLKNIGH